MAFSIRTDQLFTLGTGAFTGMLGIKKGIRSLSHFSESLFGSESVSSKLETLSVEFFSKDFYLSDLVFGTESSKDRLHHLKIAVKNAVESLVYLATAYLAFAVFTAPPKLEPIQKGLEEVVELNQASENLHNATKPFIRTWANNICFNEAMQYAALPITEECLDPKLRDIEARKQEWEQIKQYGLSNTYFNGTENLEFEIPEFLLNCSTSVGVLSAINFYKVELPKRHLRQLETLYKSMVKLSDRKVKDMTRNFDNYLSSKYLGGGMQGFFGRVVSLNHRLFCNPAGYEVFDGLEEDCMAYKDNISESKELLGRLQGIESFIDHISPNCSRFFNFNFGRMNLTRFSLPNNFMDLMREHNTEEIANHFQTSGGTETIIDNIEFNFSELPSIFSPKEGNETVEETPFVDPEEILFNQTRSKTQTSLYHKNTMNKHRSQSNNSPHIYESIFRGFVS